MGFTDSGSRVAIVTAATAAAVLLGWLASTARAAAVTSPGFTPLTNTTVDLTHGGNAIAITRIGYAGSNGGSGTGTPDTQTVTNPGVLGAFAKVGFSGTSGAQGPITNVNYNDGVDPINGAGAQTYQTTGDNLARGYSVVLEGDLLEPRYLYLYVGGFQAGATLTATNGTPADDYTNSAFNSPGNDVFGLTGFYRLTVPAGAADTTVSWVETADNGTFDNVSVFAAAVVIVPEPSALVPLLAALAASAGRRRARPRGGSVRAA
jgi:hypothetical protein